MACVKVHIDIDVKFDQIDDEDLEMIRYGNKMQICVRLVVQWSSDDMK